MKFCEKSIEILFAHPSTSILPECEYSQAKFISKCGEEELSKMELDKSIGDIFISGGISYHHTDRDWKNRSFIHGQEGHKTQF